MRRIDRRKLALLLALMMLIAGLFVAPSFSVSAAPDAGGRAPYHYHFETLHTTSGSGTMISVYRDLQLDLGESLKAGGWLATPEGVSGYAYMWLPAGGGMAEWKAVTDQRIFARDDLAAAGISYASGHGSAGFDITITPPEGTPEGYYDVYIRALDGMGTPCDLAALLNLRYGAPDVISDAGQVISIPRIRREGAAALFGDATVESVALRLTPDGGVRLGNLNLAAFESVRITYQVVEAASLEVDRTPILGLKSAGRHSYGKDGEAYNVTDSLIYAPVRERSGEITMDLTDCDYNGEVWLTGHTSGDIRITEVELVANGYGTDRVAAKINLSGDIVGAYFRGFNQTEAHGVTDSVLGDVLRLEVKDSTNDPYAHFSAGDLLRDHNIALNADEYKYMVILYRADVVNNTDRMNLYLCAGSITGATEDCNQGVSLQVDGKWHYLLVDLSTKANWEGVINGWRFDYISGNSDPRDGVEFASVQFFRTLKAASAASKMDPLAKDPHRLGDPIVIRDMSEEKNGNTEEEFILDPADTYEVTEPTTEPPTEPVTDPDGEDAPSPDGLDSTDSGEAEVTDPAETDATPQKRGCGSALASFPVILPLIAAIPLLSRKKYAIGGKKHEA